MAVLHLALIGQPVVRHAAEPPVPVAGALQPLLGLLGLERDMSCGRDRLIDSLWPDATGDRGRHRLNTTVWRCRRLFGGHGDEVIVANRSGHVALDPTAIDVDVHAIARALSDERRTAAARGDAVAIAQLREAVRIDATQFLAGNFDDWVVRTRHQLELGVVKGVETLLAVAASPSDAIEWAELLVRLDPLREDAHRRLIRLYADSGRRADALRQYDVCARTLDADLGVEPLVETTLVAAAVREGVAPLPGDLADPRHALSELRRALATCQTAVEQIESALAAMSPD
jgi:DNA-binding SARP family transcriptional activator